MVLVVALVVLSFSSFISCQVSANGLSMDGDLGDAKELTEIVLEQRKLLLDLAKKYESNEISIADLKHQVDTQSNLNNMQQKDIDALKGQIEMMSGRLIQQNLFIRKLTAEINALRKAQHDAVPRKSSDNVWKTKYLKDNIVEDKESVNNELFGLKKMDNTVENVSAMNSASDKTLNRRTIKKENIHRRFVLNRMGPVAFHAIDDGKEIHVTTSQVVPFNKVLLNIGGAFHSSGSIFIAEQPGVYIFAASVMSFVAPHDEIYAAIVKNGDILARIYGHGDTGRHDQGSATVVAQLNAGDEVWVLIENMSETYFWGNGFTTFAGALLWNI